jgi:chromosome segregation ATPase
MTVVLNELGMQLHDRFTRGQVLSAEEQEQLERWYQQQDAEEDKQLIPASPTAKISDLRSQVDLTLTQLTTSIQQIRQVTSENEELRREISTLQQQLNTLKFA